jgi:hypothetical protein
MLPYHILKFPGSIIFFEYTNNITIIFKGTLGGMRREKNTKPVFDNRKRRIRQDSEIHEKEWLQGQPSH